MTKRSFHPSDIQAIKEEYLDGIFQFVARFLQLHPDEKQAIAEQTNLRYFPKGSTLLREGQVSNLCYFVLRGCVRQYYLVDGVEKTTHFFTEGQPVTPDESTNLLRPSQSYLSCLEDSVLAVSTPEKEQQMYRKFPRLESVCRLSVEEELGKSKAHLASFILLTPEQRYLQLLQNQPDLIARVPNIHLASYLGIAPESLSRIKKRLQERIS
ncbi:MAG: Crp/Fnr family transcriptional regulator [Saprospiraceae bacterium]|jgi:CRP-like cAMP-binding protein|nr:Crp/Fnr family transcriptional regulator [Saprospiraceae bacterium]HRD79881.1 Crp/Fnr family transcriptional regulator [Saprospiraceae bacterium]HRF41965.1 Crp/Fnr family transcriptional regulator [Saprospiraceae bacterium]HRJ13539.1 Crp/Fnr family transcriptional regulator [Saprospiraceae bacterium]HRK79859.1 Crp/Fnr family transcriptional regulator [Saprospiraceae bacterium]